MKGQLKELLTQYGPISVLWYDGQWEHPWTHEMGLDLYDYTRSLQPQIIVNNRVDKGGGAMHLTIDSSYAGDYGTPEQEVPPTGIPGVDWETCMTMKDHWGYNKTNQNWKSSTTLIRTLIDIASKGGNFLLNVGPTADGVIPQASMERLADVGRWMKVNGESIYGTQASPFPSLSFGRCTQKEISKNTTKLYFHVFDWPTDGVLIIPGLDNSVRSAYLLSDPGKRLKVSKAQGGAKISETKISLPTIAPDAHATVIVAEINGRPDVALPPAIEAATPIFNDALDVFVTTGRQNVTLHYSLDGSEPTSLHPVVQQGKISINQTSTVKARAFRGKTAASPTTEATFTKVAPKPGLKIEMTSGINWTYFEGIFKTCGDMKTPLDTGNSVNFRLQPAKRLENYGLRFEGYIEVPTTGVFTFFTTSDDGSCLWIDGEKVVDNDGAHNSETRSGVIALEKGLHAIRVDYFQATGGFELKVHWQGPDVPNQPVGDNSLKRINMVN
jgi:alpha-L-fucosidase